MKIEFLEHGSENCPLVRLFDYHADEVVHLMTACDALADRTISLFALHEQSWIESVAGCRFFWRYSEKDIGVHIPSLNEPLVLDYSDEAWREVKSKLSYFLVKTPGTFNWLTREGEVEVLISATGKW